jgi:hypothetical protein
MQIEQKNSQELYNSIFLRKSCRKYDMAPLSKEELTVIYSKIADLKVLYPEIPLEARIVSPSEVQGIMRVKAPHYLVVSGHDKPGENTNAGFLFEQWILWLLAKGYGSIWLGATSPVNTEAGNKEIITIAFGRVKGKQTRSLADFIRKPINEIAQGTDPRLEAARLAPSGVNLQPWYFIVSNSGQGADSTIYIYKKRPGIAKFLYKFNDLEMGIVLSHLYLACENYGIPFEFSTDASGASEPPKGYTYFGKVR